MRNILVLLLLTISFAASAQLELPYGIKVLNPKPLDALYYATDNTPYDDTSEVISEIPGAIRYEGLTVNVAGVEYWFTGGVGDGDLEIKLAGGGSVNFAKYGVYLDGDTVKLGDTSFTGQQSFNIPVYDAGDFNGPYMNWNIAGQDLVGFGVDSRFRMSSDEGFVFESFDSYDGTFDGTSGNLRVGFSGSLVTTFNAVHENASGDTHEISVDLNSAVLRSNSGSSNNSFLLNSSASPNNSTAIYTDGSVATKTGITYSASGYVNSDRSLTDRGFVLGAKTFTGSQTFRAGTATAATAPIYLQSGTALTTPEDGAMEYHSSHLYFTIGSTRYQLDQQSSVTSSSNVDWTGSHTYTTPPANIISGTDRRTYKMLWYDNTGVNGTYSNAIHGTLTDGTLTVVFTVTGIKSDGSESIGGQYAATYNVDASTLSQVGSSIPIYEHKTDSGASITATISGGNVAVTFDSGDADSYRWTIWADVTLTEL